MNVSLKKPERRDLILLRSDTSLTKIFHNFNPNLFGTKQDTRLVFEINKRFRIRRIFFCLFWGGKIKHPKPGKSPFTDFLKVFPVDPFV